MNFTHDITISDVELFPLYAEGGVSPHMALGQMQTRPALLIKITDSHGCYGWGEIWSNFPPRANVHKAHLVEDVMLNHLKGTTFSQPVELIHHLRDVLSIYFLHIGQREVFEHILAGIDTAAWDLCLRAAGTSFARFMEITPAASVYASSLNADEFETRLQHHVKMGQTEFKLKIGFEPISDLDFVVSASVQLPGHCHLMIDSNQSWHVDEARLMLERMEGYQLLFAEEALRADSQRGDWEHLAKTTSIPLAAGENLYGIQSFLEMADAGVRYLQPDVAKWGGVSAALELADRLPKGCLLWPHFMGSAVGQQAALAVSAAIGVSSKCEMDVNDNVLRTDLCGPCLTIEDGDISLSNDTGLLTPPSPEMLDKYSCRTH
ncbi:MAG: enolase C-terminal domain-like protein [Candidatus Puniceispirillaceae bacterium]